MEPPPVPVLTFTMPQERWSPRNISVAHSDAWAALGDLQKSTKLYNPISDVTDSTNDLHAPWTSLINESKRRVRMKGLRRAHRALLEEADMAQERKRLQQIEKRSKERKDEQESIERAKREEKEARQRERDEARRAREDTTQLDFVHDDAAEMDGFENDVGGFLDDNNISMDGF